MRKELKEYYRIKPMTKYEKQEVKDCIENEGFDYTFINYSAFEHIKDEKFHDLIKKYIAAHDALENYLK